MPMIFESQEQKARLAAIVASTESVLMTATVGQFRAYVDEVAAAQAEIAEGIVNAPMAPSPGAAGADMATA